MDHANRLHTDGDVNNYEQLDLHEMKRPTKARKGNLV